MNQDVMDRHANIVATAEQQRRERTDSAIRSVTAHLDRIAAAPSAVPFAVCDNEKIVFSLPVAVQDFFEVAGYVSTDGGETYRRRK